MNVINIIQKFSGLKILVVGDVMIDAYLFGRVERISPEAPVPVVAVSREETRLGGAANVALNLVALGAKPVLCSVVGNDKDGHALIALLKEKGIGTEGIVVSDERITTVKTRVIAQNHQMLRIDSEVTAHLEKADSDALVKRVTELLSSASVMLFEDYDKGVLDSSNIRQITEAAVQKKVPVAVDPKKRNFLAYRGATLFKPNLKELKDGIHQDVDIAEKEEFEKAIVDFMQRMEIGNMFVTMSEHGVMITDGSSFEYVPAHVRQIADVSGAGDTVISVASLCLALGIPNKMIAALSNLAGGLVCEEVGVVPIDKDKLIAEAETLL